jgi:hypothetical protein
MSKPWVSSITQKGELTVYNGLKSAAWVNIFKSALQAFNQLGLPVKITQASSEESANVVMQVSLVGLVRLDRNPRTNCCGN